jgi:ankyrin repeat protein
MPGVLFEGRGGGKILGLASEAKSPSTTSTTKVDNEFVDSAACGDMDGVINLLANKDYPSAAINAVDKDGRTAFHYSCLNDDVPLLTVLLADDRVNVKQTSPKGDTALHMAALYAALEAMRLLFEDGRGNELLNAKNNFGETPLHLCAGSGDKGAAKAALLLLENGALMTVTDKWNRGPIDVSADNAENPLMATFNAYLTAHPDTKAQVQAISEAYRRENEAAASGIAEETVKANKMAKNAIFGQLGGVKLKKSKMVEKSMFNKTEGKVSAGSTAKAKGDGRRALSKLIDFPGDVNEIKKHLADEADIDPGGADAYGLTALHKFASWNKTELLALLIAKLSPEQMGAKCPEGKTALHWAVEMASVGAVKALVAAGADVDAQDGKGRTVGVILDNVESSGIIDRLKSALVHVPA